MITLSQTKEILAVFNAFYRHAFQDLSEGDAELMATMWQRKLAPYEPEEVNRAVDYITSKNKFMPSIAELIEVIEQNRNPELQTTALEAWSHVLDAIRRYGYYDYTGASQQLSERERSLVKRVGWGKLCMAEYKEMEFIKKDFIAMFEASKSEEMQQLINNHNQNIKLIENKTMQIGNGGA